MKKLIHIALFASIAILSSFSEIDPKSALDARLNAHKAECKEMIKPARYEGSRTTYFTLRKKSQFKSVELFLLLDNEYVFGVSGKACSAGITVRFYDSADPDTRMLIHEHKGIEGKNQLFSTKEMNEVYKKKFPRVERLKNIFVEYEVAPGEQHLEGIVLVIGNK